MLVFTKRILCKLYKYWKAVILFYIFSWENNYSIYLTKIVLFAILFVSQKEFTDVSINCYNILNFVIIISLTYEIAKQINLLFLGVFNKSITLIFVNFAKVIYYYYFFNTFLLFRKENLFEIFEQFNTILYIFSALMKAT